MANKEKRTNFLSTQIEIRNKIAKAIEDGTLKKGDVLPRMKNVAEENKCTLGTIMNVYKILIAEGYIHKESNRYCVTGPKHTIKTNVVEYNKKEVKPKIKRKKLEKTDGKTLYQEIRDDLVSKIEAGIYAPGHVIDSAESIAENRNVSKGTVQKAINALKHDGYVYASGTERGRGRRIIVKDRNNNNKTVENIPGSVIEKRSATIRKKKPSSKGMEFKIVSSVKGISVAVSPLGKGGFVIHVDEYK